MELKTFGVAVKAIIYNKNNEYLILKKSDKEDISPETYDFPGGRIKFGEKLEEALVREVKEESGLEVEVQGVINTWSFIKGDNFQLVGVDYLCKYIKDDQLVLSFEHSEGKWVIASEIFENQSFPDWLIKTIKKAESFKERLF